MGGIADWWLVRRWRRSAEHAGLSGLGLVAKEHARQVHVPLRGRKVGVPGTGLQRTRRDPRSCGVRDRGVEGFFTCTWNCSGDPETLANHPELWDTWRQANGR
jgi:hypothetical protein